MYDIHMFMIKHFFQSETCTFVQWFYANILCTFQLICLFDQWVEIFVSQLQHIKTFSNTRRYLGHYVNWLIILFHHGLRISLVWFLLLEIPLSLKNTLCISTCVNTLGLYCHMHTMSTLLVLLFVFYKQLS